MIESPKLTARQQQILDLVQSTIARRGNVPNLNAGLTVKF